MNCLLGSGIMVLQSLLPNRDAAAAAVRSMTFGCLKVLISDITAAKMDTLLVMQYQQ
jgi:hypothetical protein